MGFEHIRDVDDVLAEFDRIVDRARAEGDRSGWFAALYRKVTVEVQRGMRTGFFDDAERMDRLDTLFAVRYFAALEAHRRGHPLTRSWRLTFDAARRWRPVVTQHLLVGMNAHINLDLGICAAQCSPGSELPGLRRDFDRINAILYSLFDDLLDALGQVSPWVGLVQRIGGGGDQQVLRWSIAVARAGAWRFASTFDALPEHARDAAIIERDSAVARIGERVMAPGAPADAALLLVRARERHRVAEVIDLLGRTPAPSLTEVERRAQRFAAAPPAAP